ncbi:Protein kinase domain [Arabidopsis thaliana x Arabidopsis arenosa]|uniref:Protein kinase domain n=1 Tax=Arabidopsis thaliana x Arabidopsis arenosa TaxID=1240361 RepID=A0A8T2EUK7_9BRAS|nr:Protein kinase domain [Arabidopsis thaliana x Arabidopsis arenosa]
MCRVGGVIQKTFRRFFGDVLFVGISQSTQQLTGLSCGSVVGTEVQRNPVTNKKRSVSPLPHMALSDAFIEAKSDIKRFSTPHPRRVEPEKGMKAKSSSRKDSSEKKSVNLRSLSHSGPIRDLSTQKVKERGKSKIDKKSSKSVDYRGSKVSSAGVLEECLIDVSKLSYGDRFAHGKYSQIYHGEYEGKAVALKIITAPEDSDDIFLGARLEKEFIVEATLLSRLSHPNVVKFVGVNTGNCIITEYVPRGSLRSYLHKLEQKSLPLEQLIDFGLDIAKGMEYIHSREIVHQDLKPENVLIDNDFHLKIADFGIACEEEYCDVLGDNIGTYRWMAPEVLKRIPHGRKCDVYSFGLLLWEMVAGALPYEEMKFAEQIAYAVIYKKIRPVIPTDCPAAMKELIERCWSSQTDKRPEFWQIVKVLEHFKKSLTSEGKLNLLPSQICPELKKCPKFWIHIFGSFHHHSSGGGSSSNNSALPKPKFA